VTADVAAARKTEVDYGNFSITAKREIMHMLASSVVPAVSSSDTRPVLKCFRVEVRDGVLLLSATNMEMTIQAETRAFVKSWSDGDNLTYIPAKKLLTILAEAPDGDVTVKVKKNLATITAGAGSSWTLRLPDGDQWPVMVDPALAQVYPADKGRFLDALKTVRHTVGKEASRPSFMQVDVAEHGGRMCLTSSDGGRFTQAAVDGFPVPMSIPAGALDQLIKLLAGTSAETMEVADFEGSLLFRVGPVSMLVQKFGQPFAKVDQLMLKPASDNTLKLTVDREELVSAVRRVRINASADTSAVALQIMPGKVIVEARDDERNSAVETVLAGWADHQGELVLTVNHTSLLSMLAVHPSNSCVFMLAKNVGKRRSMVLLADEQAGVTSIITQMPHGVTGF
jgi:DNA polymerase III subunit beta